VNVVGHHFHSLDEHAVLLRRGEQKVLQASLNVTDENFATILWHQTM
jgi:hypothetical protein